MGISEEAAKICWLIVQYYEWAILAVVLAFFCFMTIWTRRVEIREWNGGVCRKNGIRWKSFDMDSSGSIGYKAGDEVLWISWWDVTRRRTIY